MSHADDTAARAMRHPVIAAYDLALGAGLLAGIWGGLPDRWWPVDIFGSALAASLLGVGLALVARRRWAERAALALAALVLVAGLVLVAALAVTSGELAGMYGPVGQGGAAILAVAFLLFLPYLVVFPAAQVYFLLGVDRGRASASVREERERPAQEAGVER
jgi:hypothetical protein